MVKEVGVFRVHHQPLEQETARPRVKLPLRGNNQPTNLAAAYLVLLLQKLLQKLHRSIPVLLLRSCHCVTIEPSV